MGLSAALTWGAGDFGGGSLVKRAPVLAVVLVSQLVGAAIAFVFMVLRAEALPTTTDVAWSVVGGVIGALGIVMLYRGLAVGRMGVVAPVTGVISAVMPVLFGIASEGMPAPLVLAGIGLAIVAVVLVSRVDDGRGGPSGLGLALVAGVAIGSFGIVISQISEGSAFGPLTIIRVTEAVLIVGVVMVAHQTWRASQNLIPAMAGVGVLDMAGNATFILAIQAGSLAIAAVLSSLYPVTTVILAALILKERVTRAHAIGIALAAAGIVCITAGSG